MLLLSLQGVRVSETPEGISSLDPSRGESINVEPGCSWPDPCDSNPCPTNSYCSNDWDSYSCSCYSGMLRKQGWFHGSHSLSNMWPVTSSLSRHLLKGYRHLAQCSEWE